MLYDPKWDKQAETKADPFVLDSLIAWLEKQPAHGKYDYLCHGHCLLAQYFQAAGYGSVTAYSNCIILDGKKIPLPGNWNWVANKFDDSGCKRTFGGALKRAREVAALTSTDGTN